MNIVFMGTPAFAVPSLRKLAGSHNVVAVFCQPDRPKGRGNKLQACPVKEAALELGLPVYQGERIRTKAWLEVLRNLAPDLIVVAAFGQILSQKILDLPQLGCINVHASLLPRWRGASPIHYAIKSGDSQSGVAIMKMVLALDAGPVYAEQAVPITPGLGRQELEDQLAEVGGELLLQTLPQLATIGPKAQEEALVTYAPIIGKDFGFVDPATQTAPEIERTLRAFEGWPGVFVDFRGQKMKLAQATVGSEACEGQPGQLSRVTKKEVWLACAHKTELRLDSLQLPGKNLMPAVAFINGYQPQIGETMGAIQTPT